MAVDDRKGKGESARSLFSQTGTTVFQFFKNQMLSIAMLNDDILYCITIGDRILAHKNVPAFLESAVGCRFSVAVTRSG